MNENMEKKSTTLTGLQSHKSIDIKIYYTKKNIYSNFVIIMARTGFRVNPNSIVVCLSRNSLLETDAISEV